MYTTPGQHEDSIGFDLIRQAEGEKHTSIDKKRLPQEKRVQFNRLLGKIREAIRGMATRDDADTHIPEGFMELELTAGAERINPRSPQKNTQPKSPKSRDFTPVPEQIDLLPDGPPRDKPHTPERERRDRVTRSTGRRVSVAAAARRDNQSVRMIVRPTEDIASAALRLSADQGADASCTSPLADEPIHLRIAGETGTFVRELNIGQLREGQRYEFNVDVGGDVPSEAVLKVDVLSRRALMSAGEGE